MEMTSKASQIQAPLLFPDVGVPTRDKLLADGALRAADSLDRSAKAVNSDHASPHEMWHSKASPLTTLPFLKESSTG